MAVGAVVDGAMVEGAIADGAMDFVAYFGWLRWLRSVDALVEWPDGFVPGIGISSLVFSCSVVVEAMVERPEGFVPGPGKSPSALSCSAMAAVVGSSQALPISVI